MLRSDRISAFTLIELLVVVTIIVVLLAMLTPALDQAIYQAELAVCATNQHGIVLGAQNYAVNSQRRYPYRPGARGNDKPANNIVGGAPRWDDRPYIKNYIDLKLLVDPLTMKLDLSTEKSSYVWIAYTLWYGFKYNAADKGMFKIGDRFTWGSESFGVVVSDYDLVHLGALTHAAHPDREGKNHLAGGQDKAGVVVGDIAVEQGGVQTAAWWDTSGHERGAIDVNSGFEDGSVSRRKAVKWNEWQDGEGFSQVPDYVGNTGFAQRYIQIPKR